LTLMGSVAAYAQSCNPLGRIDARCYPDLQTATAAVIAANQPLRLPAGTYTPTQTLIIDYAPVAATGFQIISDGAILDGRSISGAQTLRIECGGGNPGRPDGLLLLPNPRHAIRQRQYVGSRRPVRPQRFLGRAQFGEDRPPDRQQRRPRLGSAAELHLERRHLRRGGVGRISRARDGSGAVLAHFGRRVSDHRHPDADRAGLKLRKHDPGDRPRGRANRSDDQLALREPQHFRVTLLQLPDADRCKRRLQQSAGQSQLRRCIATEHGELDRSRELPMKCAAWFLRRASLACWRECG